MLNYVSNKIECVEPKQNTSTRKLRDIEIWDFFLNML